jgi:hypothetical protein
MSLPTRLSLLPQKEHQPWSDGSLMPLRDPLRQVPHNSLPKAPSPLVVLYDVVYDTVLDGLIWAHYVVAVGVALDPLVGLAGVLG